MQLSVFIYVYKISFSSSSAIHERETVYCKRFFLFESAVGVGASPPGKYTELLTVHIDCDMGENYCPSHPLSMHYFQATDDTYTHTPLVLLCTTFPSHPHCIKLSQPTHRTPPHMRKRLVFGFTMTLHGKTRSTKANARLIPDYYSYYSKQPNPTQQCQPLFLPNVTIPNISACM